jgi:hypothetical protein
MKVHQSGTIIKAYEKDSVWFASDALWSVEGTTVRRSWTARTVFDVEDRFSPWYQYTDTPSGTSWCTSIIEKAKGGRLFGQRRRAVRAREVVRGRETANRAVSRCPDESCCRRTDAEPRPARWRQIPRVGSGRRTPRVGTARR